MDLSRIDLNLLVYLDTLLREKNVTRAAEQLGIHLCCRHCGTWLRIFVWMC